MHETQRPHRRVMPRRCAPSSSRATTMSRLTDRAVDILRESGGMRLLQAKDLGGFEEHPNEFFDWVIQVGTEHPSAGWIAGVVGVHPWEISIMDPTAPGGGLRRRPRRAHRVAVRAVRPGRPASTAASGSPGRWPYSTGTDHAGWIILGGMVADELRRRRVSPPDVRHFVLPRGDWTHRRGLLERHGAARHRQQGRRHRRRLRARTTASARRRGCTTAATPASAGPTRRCSR